MKSFDEFKKDLSEMDRSLTGPGLVGAGIRTFTNVATGPLRNASRVANVLRSDKGKKILKGLFGTPDKPKWDEYDKTDSLPKPKDDVDSELNTRQRQVKDAEKNKEHDDAMKVYGKTIDKKSGKTTLSPEDQIEVIKAAAKKHKSNQK